MTGEKFSWKTSSFFKAVKTVHWTNAWNVYPFNFRHFITFLKQCVCITISILCVYISIYPKFTYSFRFPFNWICIIVNSQPPDRYGNWHILWRSLNINEGLPTLLSKANHISNNVEGYIFNILVLFLKDPKIVWISFLIFFPCLDCTPRWSDQNEISKFH